MTHARAMLELLVRVACAEAVGLGHAQVIGHGCGWSVGSNLPEIGSLEALATVEPGERPKAVLDRVREALEAAECRQNTPTDLPGQLKMF